MQAVLLVLRLTSRVQKRTVARNMFSTTPNSSLLEPGQEMDIIVTMVGFTHEQYKEVSFMPCIEKSKILVLI